MIVDTSALVALAREESGRETLRDALLLGESIIPAPVVVEFRRVTAGSGNLPHPDADRLLAELQDAGATVEAFTAADADLAAAANVEYGTGNGRGGRLNMLDLMVYGMARRIGAPILCTGTDFLSTGIAIHPASRRW